MSYSKPGQGNHAFRANLVTSTVSGTSNTVLSWSEVLDRAGDFNDGLDRFAPSADGLYMLLAMIVQDSDPQFPARTASIRKNGSTIISARYVTDTNSIGGNNVFHGVVVPALIYATVGDYFEVVYNHNLASGSTTLKTTGYSVFSGYKIRAE